jgi:hypothetical protein
MSKSFGLTKTRNILFKNESLCLIRGRPARTSTDSTCVDLVRPKQIRPALHCIHSISLLTSQRSTLRRILKQTGQYFYKVPADRLGLVRNALHKINPCVASLLEKFSMQPLSRDISSKLKKTCKTSQLRHYYPYIHTRIVMDEMKRMPHIHMR